MRRKISDHGWFPKKSGMTVNLDCCFDDESKYVCSGQTSSLVILLLIKIQKLKVSTVGAQKSML